MSLFEKFKIGLNKSSQNLTKGLDDLIFKKKIDESALQNLEDFLIESDVGVEATKEIKDKISEEKINPNSDQLNQVKIPCRYSIHLSHIAEMFSSACFRLFMPVMAKSIFLFSKTQFIEY